MADRGQLSPAPRPTRSIALLTYPEDKEFRYANGFFLRRKERLYCVTCAHVFDERFHPGPDRSRVLVNNVPGRLELDARRQYGVDVALVEVEADIASVHPQALGLATAHDRVYYAHAWSVGGGRTDAAVFEKLWGLRVRRLLQTDVRTTKQSYAWILAVAPLRNRVPAAFDAQRFQPGWSGAPVFNIAADRNLDAVVGVLSVVAQEGGAAKAVSVESLQFLEGVQPQQGEGRLFPPTAAQRLRSWMTRTPEVWRIGHDDAANFDEEFPLQQRARDILQQYHCPFMTEPPTPYD